MDEVETLSTALEHAIQLGGPEESVSAEVSLLTRDGFLLRVRDPLIEVATRRSSACDLRGEVVATWMVYPMRETLHAIKTQVDRGLVWLHGGGQIPLLHDLACQSPLRQECRGRCGM